MLERFFAGVLSQLQAEVDLINALVPHNATKGTLNEESLRRILAAFLPTRYAVGSGFVIDSFGGRSRQVDLIVFDELYSSKLFKMFSQVLFPVETVFACIEVKTTIDKTRLTEVAQENQSIFGLKHSVPVVRRVSPSTMAPNAIEFSEHQTRSPLTYLVAYHTETDSPLTVRRWFEQSSDKEFLPDLALFLDLSMIAYRPRPVEKSVFDFLLMPARNTDIGLPQKGIVYVPTPCATSFLNGRAYRSSRWKGKEGYPLIMPEKALLSFLIQLSRAVDAFPKLDSFDPTPYLAQYSDEGLDVLDNERA